MTKEKHLTSKEAKTTLKVRDCELMHLRTAGKLKYIKKGNAYMYLEESVKDLQNKETK